MPPSIRYLVGSLVLWLLAPVVLQAGGIPVKMLKELKAAAVYIKVEFVPIVGQGKAISATGSGFLFRVADGAGYIATNSHVVAPLAGEKLGGPIKVIFHSGMPSELTVDAHVVARDAVRDLAILKIAGFQDMPIPIKIDPDIEVGETMPVYAMGFPFGGALALGKKNPSLNITKGTISSLRYDDRGQVKLVQIDAEINSGNSGGPVVNEKGQLVGVAVSKLINTRTVGFAVPLKALTEMIEGRIAAVVFDTLWVVKDHAEVTIEAGLINPFGKLKDAAILYRVVEDEAGLPMADKDGMIPPLKESKQVWLKMTGARGQGRFTLKGRGADNVKIAYQASHVGSSGKTVYSPVGIKVLDFTQIVHTDQLAGDDPKDAKGMPTKVYVQPMTAGKHYVLNMRADPKDLDPRVAVQDASGKTLAEDDGTGGLFDAVLLFSPPKDGDYHIVAGSGRGMGPYTLVVRQETGQEPGPKGLTMAGVLRTAETLDPQLQTPQQSYNLFLKKGRSYTINVKSKDFDPFVRLESMGRVVLKNEDIGGGGQSTLFFAPFQDGLFRITASAFDGKVGQFDVTVRDVPNPKEQEVGADGLKLAGVLTVSDPIDIVNGKAGRARCKVYPVKMKSGQKYQIDLVSNQFDTFLRVEDARGRELASDDDSGGNLNARLLFTAPADGVFRIIATQFDSRFGNFDLVVLPKQ